MQHPQRGVCEYSNKYPTPRAVRQRIGPSEQESAMWDRMGVSIKRLSMGLKHASEKKINEIKFT